MAITSAEIKELDFGYLTGADLLSYCPEQLLIKEHTVNDNKLNDGVQTAYNEIISHLNSRYLITSELEKTGSSRYAMMVKITALKSIQNICSDLAAVTENLKTNFDWADKTLRDIRNGQISLVGIKVQTNESVASVATVINSSFRTIG